MELLLRCACSPIALQKCQISTSSVVLSRKIRRYRKNQYGSKEVQKQHIKFQPKKWRGEPELYTAQRNRRKCDFPLGEDQRATWKHRMWFDEFMSKWVFTAPDPNRKQFQLYKKEKRQLIHELDTVQENFLFLLDRDEKKKYILPAFNMDFPRNSSYFSQYATNTKFVHGLPYNIESINVDDSMIENFEKFLTSALQLEVYYNPNTCNEKSRKKRADRIISTIVRYLMSQATHSDFVNCELDREIQNDMFWQRGRGFYKYNYTSDVPVTFQSHDTPLLQIRTQKPLLEFTPWMEKFMLTGEIPTSRLLPYAYGFDRRKYQNMITPGYKLTGGDALLNYQEAMEQGKLLELPPPIKSSCGYGHTQFISLPEKFSREWYQHNLEHCDIVDELEEHLKSHGIISGWTWSAALAHYMGHWMDNDLNKPISVQSVISDGQYFSFFCYQLNTVAIDPENVDIGANQRRNICFGTPTIKLYDTVEGTDDIELYRDATTLLLKFILNNNKNAADSDKIIEHNATLEVQKWDTENPEIELQEPKHVRERKATLEVAKQKEIEANRGVKEKVWEWIKT